MQPLRILLVQLGANGDCLFVTTLAKQIKEIDYPGCHLTWMIGSFYRQVITNNKYVDNIYEIPFAKKEDLFMNRTRIHELVAEAKNKQYYDKIFVTDFTPENYEHWVGSTRSSLFRTYPHRLKIAPKPIIFLTPIEQENVSSFCKRNRINERSFNILFECSPNSGQSLIDFKNGLMIAEQIACLNPSVKIIMSSNKAFTHTEQRIIDGSVLSWRENAELANYCQLLIGCSSGITWLCTSNWVKEIPMIQTINPDYFNGRITASVKADFKYFGLPTNNIIELYNPTNDLLKEVIDISVKGDFKRAKRLFDEFDQRPFKQFVFLKNSRMSVFQKAKLLVKYHAVSFLKETYRKIKPRWFSPRQWMRKLFRM